MTYDRRVNKEDSFWGREGGGRGNKGVQKNERDDSQFFLLRAFQLRGVKGPLLKLSSSAVFHSDNKALHGD